MYKALKGRLLDSIGLSLQERTSRLLYIRPMGYSNPSAPMDEMWPSWVTNPLDYTFFNSSSLSGCLRTFRFSWWTLILKTTENWPRGSMPYVPPGKWGSTPSNTTYLQCTSWCFPSPKVPSFLLQTLFLSLPSLETQLGGARILVYGWKMSRPVSSSGLGKRL